MAGQKKKTNTAPATPMTVAQASTALANAQASLEAIKTQWEADVAATSEADRLRGRAKHELELRKTDETQRRYDKATEDWKVKKGLAVKSGRKMTQAKKMVGVYTTARNRAQKREAPDDTNEAAVPTSPMLSELSDVPDDIPSGGPSQAADPDTSVTPALTDGVMSNAGASFSGAPEATASNDNNSIATPAAIAEDNSSEKSTEAPPMPAEKPLGSADADGLQDADERQDTGSKTDVSHQVDDPSPAALDNSSNAGPTRKRTGSDTQPETRPQKKAKGIVNFSDSTPDESSKTVEKEAEVPSEASIINKETIPAPAPGKSGKKKTKSTPHHDGNAHANQAGPANGKKKGKGKSKAKGKAKATSEDEDNAEGEPNGVQDSSLSEVPPRTIKSAKKWLQRCKATTGPSSIPKVSQGLTTYVLKHSSTIPEAATSSWQIALAAMTSQKGFAKCRFHTLTEKTTGRRFDNDKELFGTPWPGVTKAMKAANDNNAVGNEEEDGSSGSEDDKEPDIREMDPLHCASWSPWWWKRVKGRAPKALDCGCDIDDVLLDFYLFKTGKLTSPTMSRSEGWKTDWVRPRQRALYLASWREGTKLTVYDCYSMVSVKGQWKQRDPADITKISISRMQISVGLPVTVTLPSWYADADATPGSPVMVGASGNASTGRKMLKYVEIDED
ncbi:hypothetical protein VNI00_017664 [Paramarasmius palmivorus]|uniref:Uncharacterized protein n=1 Tax=Paramarasmius palmivorus TaxID=297713 RepID=A0AAW0B4F7_9AGAR